MLLATNPSSDAHVYWDLMTDSFYLCCCMSVRPVNLFRGAFMLIQVTAYIGISNLLHHYCVLVMIQYQKAKRVVLTWTHFASKRTTPSLTEAFVRQTLVPGGSSSVS